MEVTMTRARELLDRISRRTDAFLSRLGGSASDPADEAAAGRFTLPGLIALLAAGARDRPRQALVPDDIDPATIARAMSKLGRLAGSPIGVDEARAATELLTTGEFVGDTIGGLRVVLTLVPRVPVAVTRDVLTLPELPREIVEAIRADLKDDASRRPRDVVLDLRDGKLDHRRRVLTNTLQVLLVDSTPGVLVETIRDLIGPENRTVRLAVIIYARTQGVDLDEKDLDALVQALDPANPDLGVLLDRGLERVTAVHGDASRAVAVVQRLAPRRPAGRLG
jgi:hypothetical protein